MEGGCDRHMTVSHQKTAGGIIPPPTGSGEIRLRPGVHVWLGLIRRRTLITADEPGGDAHSAASVAE